MCVCVNKGAQIYISLVVSFWASLSPALSVSDCLHFVMYEVIKQINLNLRKNFNFKVNVCGRERHLIRYAINF